MFGRARSIAPGLSGWLFAASLIAITLPARAKPLRLELVWNAPEGCPDAAHVLAAIHQLMGATENLGPPELSVRADILARDSTLQLQLVWQTASMQAERSMESASCDELARAAALVVALAADPSAADAVAEESAPSAELIPSASAAPTLRPPRPYRNETERPSSFRNASLALASPPAATADFTTSTLGAASEQRAPRIKGRAQWALDLGSLPRTAEGATAGFSFERGAGALQADLSLFVPQTKSVAEGSAELWLSALSVRPCLHLSLARLRVLPCAVAELDLSFGTGQGVESRQSGAAWFPRFGGGTEFGYPLTAQIAWITEGWLLAGPWRPTFVLDDVVPVHQPSLLVGRWTTGLELRL